MKESYNDLRCPYCGSKSNELISNNVFLCEYCNQKFSFALDEIALTNENKVLVEELKEKFYEKITTLNEQKRQAHSNLLYYKNLTKPKILVIVSRIFFALTIFFLFLTLSMLVNNNDFTLFDKLLSLLCSGISLSVFLYAKYCDKKRDKKYQPYVSYYASKIVDCENEIAVYSKAISRLIP